MNILIFDRSLEVRFSLSRNIGQINSDRKITAVESMNAVLSEIDSTYYDIVIIDMDNLRGKFREMISILDKKNPEALVILLTLFPNKNITNKFLESGADYCFDKVGQFDGLLKLLKEHLDNNGQMKSTQERHQAV